MEFKELETTVKKAASVIQEYNKTVSAIEKIRKDKEIKELKSILLSEAYALGPSGEICPKCGGSGRI